MTLLDTFHEIGPDDTVSVEYKTGSFTKPVMSLEGDGTDRVVGFDIPQTEPRLVRRFDRVWLETRAKGHPPDWSTYEPVTDLQIVSEGN